jgi:preprotein translocase subunit SecG
VVSIIVGVHALVCVSLVIVVLLQQGKGADIGAVFGGSSQTVFGSSGAGNFLTKLTSGLAVVFFATSIFLAYASTRRATGSLLERSRAAQRSAMPQNAPKPASNPAIPAPLPNAPAPAPK